MELQQVLLTEKQVAEQTGLPVSKLWSMRRTGRGIPFIKLSPGRVGRIRYRLEDVEAYLAANPKKPGKESKQKPAPPARLIEPVTVTCEEAARRHQGQTAVNIARMCLRGKYLAKRYGGASRVPAKDAATVIFAVKLGKWWQVPVSELDRVFLGKQG